VTSLSFSPFADAGFMKKIVAEGQVALYPAFHFNHVFIHNSRGSTDVFDALSTIECDHITVRHSSQVDFQAAQSGMSLDPKFDLKSTLSRPARSTLLQSHEIVHYVHWFCRVVSMKRLLYFCQSHSTTHNKMIVDFL
jgi:hypothetical protein